MCGNARSNQIRSDCLSVLPLFKVNHCHWTVVQPYELPSDLSISLSGFKKDELSVNCGLWLANEKESEDPSTENI